MPETKTDSYMRGFIDRLQALEPSGSGAFKLAESDGSSASSAVFGGVRALYRMLARAAACSSGNGANVSRGMAKNVFNGRQCQQHLMEQNGKA